MRVVILHDYNCPLGDNGIRAFDEASQALADTPPEARATQEDRRAIAVAWSELLARQTCSCGAADEIRRRQGNEDGKTR